MIHHPEIHETDRRGRVTHDLHIVYGEGCQMCHRRRRGVKSSHAGLKACGMSADNPVLWGGGAGGGHDFLEPEGSPDSNSMRRADF